MFAFAESSIQSKHTLKQERNVLIPIIEIAMEFRMCSSILSFPIFKERKKLEVQRIADAASAITHKRLAMIDAIVFFCVRHFILSVRKERHKRLAERNSITENPAGTKTFACTHPSP